MTLQRKTLRQKNEFTSVVDWVAEGGLDDGCHRRKRVFRLVVEVLAYGILLLFHFDSC